MMHSTFHSWRHDAIAWSNASRSSCEAVSKNSSHGMQRGKFSRAPSHRMMRRSHLDPGRAGRTVESRLSGRMSWLKSRPTTKSWRKRSPTTLSKFWLKHAPKVNCLKPLGRVTLSMLWLNSAPKVSLYKPLGKLTLSML